MDIGERMFIGVQCWGPDPRIVDHLKQECSPIIQWLRVLGLPKIGGGHWLTSHHNFARSRYPKLLTLSRRF